MFKDPPLVEGAVVGGKPVEVARVKPPQVMLPGLKLTYELLVDDPDGRKMPLYCYVGAVDLTKEKEKDQAAAIYKQLAGGNPKPDSLTQWSDFQAQSPDGKTVAWRQIRCEGKQEFRGKDKAGQDQPFNEPGILEIDLREEGNYLIVIAWRAPKSIEQKAELAKWPPLVAGCAVVKK
jgi:hypothetical protein